jgi:hypothetical protein
MVHAGIAGVTGNEFFAIDESEANALATAAANVQQHYPSAVLDPVTMDWIGLIVTCGTIYGPRIVAMKMERAERRAEQATQTPRTTAAPPPRREAPAAKVGGVDLTSVVPPGFGPAR